MRHIRHKKIITHTLHHSSVRVIRKHQNVLVPQQQHASRPAPHPHRGQSQSTLRKKYRDDAPCESYPPTHQTPPYDHAPYRICTRRSLNHAAHLINHQVGATNHSKHLSGTITQRRRRRKLRSCSRSLRATAFMLRTPTSRPIMPAIKAIRPASMYFLCSGTP